MFDLSSAAKVKESTECKEQGERVIQGERKDLSTAWEILLRRTAAPFNSWSNSACAFPSSAGCQFPPPSSQAGAGLAAVYSPALHNKAASKTPL